MDFVVWRCGGVRSSASLMLVCGSDGGGRALADGEVADQERK